MEGKATCHVCMHHCSLAEGRTGICRARRNTDGNIIPINYGRLTSIALDPIEKKPLYMFCPGSMILSVGSFGCNLSCPFCQNHSISQVGEDTEYDTVTPEQLTALATELIPRGNIGIAYTYNEALVGYEFVRDTARLVHEAGLKNVLVSNGEATTEVLQEILPYIDAMNIDLKAFTRDAYKSLGGDLDMVMNWIEQSHPHTHMEITSLIVPGLNDSLDEMEEEASWIASLDPDIPLHITRYFPRYRQINGGPTDIALLKELQHIAEKHLKNVFMGNV